MQQHQTTSALPVGAPLLSLCPICDKAFTQERQFHRHVNYCQKAQTRRKGRSKACLACNSSKLRCDFATPRCGRCDKKGLGCVYDSRPGYSGRAVRAAEPTAVRHKAPVPVANVLLTPESSLGGSDEAASSNESSPGGLLGDYDGTVQRYPPPMTEPGSIDVTEVDMESFGNFIMGIEGAMDPADRGSNNNDEMLSTTWPPPPPSTTIENMVRTRAAGSFAPLNQKSLGAKHAANLISRIISAFPQMMLRRQTFPPFIHPYWHKSAVPKILASCMNIAQLFVTRTPDTRAFVWRTIEAEGRFLLEKAVEFTAIEIQQAIQAITIYIIMAIIDQDADTPVRGREMMMTFLELKLQLQRLIGGELVMSETEKDNPSRTWEDWIFAESRRRIGCLWFAITHVFALKTERNYCAAFRDAYVLPLLSSKCVWEARSRDEWSTEKCLDDVSYPMMTFGELITAQRTSDDPVSTHKLNSWESGGDKLAVMMNIAIELISV